MRATMRKNRICYLFIFRRVWIRSLWIFIFLLNAAWRIYSWNQKLTYYRTCDNQILVVGCWKKKLQNTGRFLPVCRFKVPKEELHNNILCVLVLSSEKFRRLVLRSCRWFVLPSVLNQFLMWKHISSQLRHFNIQNLPRVTHRVLREALLTEKL